MVIPGELCCEKDARKGLLGTVDVVKMKREQVKTLVNLTKDDEQKKVAESKT